MLKNRVCLQTFLSCIYIFVKIYIYTHTHMCTPVCCILASTGIKNFSNLETVSVLKLDVSLIYK